MVETTPPPQAERDSSTLEDPEKELQTRVTDLLRQAAASSSEAFAELKLRTDVIQEQVKMIREGQKQRLTLNSALTLLEKRCSQNGALHPHTMSVRVAVERCVPMVNLDAEIARQEHEKRSAAGGQS